MRIKLYGFDEESFDDRGWTQIHNASLNNKKKNKLHKKEIDI